MICFMLENIISGFVWNSIRNGSKLTDVTSFSDGWRKVKIPTAGRDCLEDFQVYYLKNCIICKTKSVP